MKQTGPIINNVFKRVTITCMNHSSPLKMEILQNMECIKTPFYACENYFQKELPKDVKGCANRLNLSDYEDIILKLSEILGQRENLFADMTGYTFTYKGTRQKILVKILKYSQTGEIVLGIKNETVLHN